MLYNIKALLAKQFSTLYFFYKYLGNKIFLLLIFNFLMVLMDGFGLTMFVPLLQVADGDNSVSNSEGFIEIITNAFNIINIKVNIINILILIVLIFVFKSFFSFFTSFFQAQTIYNFSRKLREKLIKGITYLNYKEFVKTDVGRMQNSLLGESYLVATASSLYLDTIKNGMIVAVYLGFAFSMDWKFSVLVTIGGLITNFIYQRFYKTTQKLSREITKKNHKYGGIVIEIVNHFKYLKATSRNLDFEKRLSQEMNMVVDNHIEIGKLSAKLNALREPMMIIIVCIVIAVQVLFFQSPLSPILIILLLFYRAMTYIMALQTSWNSYLSHTGTLENVLEFEKYLEVNKELNNGKQTVNEIKLIEINDLSVNYGDVKVLRNINLSIKKNQSIALVGESGSGKTTLINVICGLLTYDMGNIKINNTLFEEIDKNSYKSKIGYISQEPTIFNGDIYDNVTFWASRSEENIIKFNKVIEMCSLGKFIENLPNGYNELLGNNGLNISGGQKQRISIARELFKEVEVLIMDEATSALDSETEHIIKESIDSLKGEITIISIAHRLSTVRHADIIHLMDKGTIKESGNFEDLKRKSTYFTQLAQLQGL